MPTDARRIEELLTDLVRIESVTPWLIPDGAGEGRIAAFAADWLRDLPVAVTLDEVAPGRPNLVARLPGTGGGPTLGVNAHSDTVGYANWPDTALTPVREGDRLVGLGAADDKSGCTIALLVLRELATGGPRLRGDLLVALTVDEEGASVGTEDLVIKHAMDAAIVLEPETAGRVIVEHQGFGWIDIVVHGRAAHGSSPEAGIDAIVRMAEVIRGLHRRDVDVYQSGPVPFNGRTVFHASTIRGGTDYATYPASAVLGIEIGTQPGERLADRIREIQETFREVRTLFPDFRGEVNVRLEREPFRSQGHEALLAAADRASLAVLRRPLERVGLNAWTDAALMQAAGIPTIEMGPAGGNFHAPQEWVSVPEVAQTLEMVRRTAVEFLG